MSIIGKCVLEKRVFCVWFSSVGISRSSSNHGTKLHNATFQLNKHSNATDMQVKSNGFVNVIVMYIVMS